MANNRSVMLINNDISLVFYIINMYNTERLNTKLYHKIFKADPNLSIYLENPDPLKDYAEELLNHLTHAGDMEDLHQAKVDILTDFSDIYNFDVTDAEFPEPTGHFDNAEEKRAFVEKRILLHDIVLYLGNIYKWYHEIIYNKQSRFPEIRLKNMAIDYTEIYQKAAGDYKNAIVNGMPHAVTASFMLPSLIERGLTLALQSRMLCKCICGLPDIRHLKEAGLIDAEEEKYIEIFIHNTEGFCFDAKEEHVMGKMYTLFVRQGVLEESAENEMVLTGVGHRNRSGRKLTRTLGALLKSDFAKSEILPEYMELMDNIFVKLNIRNSIMHGLGESFDYLNIGLVSIMFQLLWDIGSCEIFKN